MRAPDWQTDDGRIQLYCGDCLELLPQMEAGSVDAVVTDPPYGIGVDASMHKCGGTQYGNAAAPKRLYRNTNWDHPLSANALAAILAVGQEHIIFGGNYYVLPQSRCWLIWDKVNGTNAFGDAELAWTDLDKPIRLKRHMWNGMLRDGREIRVAHPTQKPLAVMCWALSFVRGNVILDPFMGSGTTGVACVKTNRRFIGIEIDRGYFDIAVKRIKAAIDETALFDRGERFKQGPLFDGGET